MTWFRVDDGFPEHPKVEALERKPRLYTAAITVWTIMGADCARRLTDGFVSKVRLGKVLFHLGKTARDGVAALVECGLWYVVDGGWQYHDWQEYQPAKVDVDAQRKAKNDRQRRWRDHAVDASTQPSRDARVDAPRDASTQPPRDAPPVRVPAGAIPARVSRPVPSRPVPERKREGAGALSVRAPASGFAPSESESESETQPQTQPPDPAVLTAGQLRDLFRKTWLTHRSIDPPFPAEAELDDLAERVVNAAAIRRLPPAQLFTSALEHWARSELNPREKRSPVQCFAQAFGEVVDQVVTSLPVTPSAHDLLVKRSAEAVRVRNFDLYNELQAELRAMNGSGHAP